jgi:hypothetical protein
MFRMDRCLTSAVFCLLALAVTRSDEAILRDGRRITGQLKMSEARWQFEPAKGVLKTEALSEVRLVPTARPPLHAGLPLRLLLRDEQRLTADLIDADEKNIRMQSGALSKLTVPRAVVAGLRQPPGWAVCAIRDGDCILDTTGQSAEVELPKPLTEGRLSLSFLDDNAADARWLVEATFKVDGKARQVSVQVGGDSEYRARVDGLKPEENTLARSAGRHRLVIQFSPVSLRAGIDDAILWHTLKSGPGGPLVSIRMACREREKGKPARGKISIDNVCLHQAVEEPRRPAGDAKQDEAWLLDDGQVFGKWLRADRQGVQFAGAFGRRTLPWALVRGIYPRQQDSTAVHERDEVRLWIDNGFDSQPDWLDGVVKSMDAERLIVRHAELGELTLARAALLRVVWPGNDRP